MNSLRFSGLFAAGILACASAAGAEHHAAGGAQPAASKASPYRNIGRSHQSDQYYASTWGIEQLRLQRTASGALIRFSYHVVDANKAKAVHLKKAEPHLLGLRSHAMLSVPTLENVGQLRQTEAITEGKDYWILFSNKGDLVKVGDRVDVIIGDFYANSLTVE
jgi:hypothetical protein